MGCASTASTNEQQEYAGRFVSTSSGSSVPITSVADAFVFDDCVNPDVVMWDLHESDERDRGAIFSALKAKLVEHLLEKPGRAAFIVDEAVERTCCNGCYVRHRLRWAACFPWRSQ